MNNSSERKLGAILSYVTIILTTLIQLVYTPFLIKNLGQSEYGLYSLINSIIGYLTILDLGFGNAIVVYTSKYRAQKKFDEEKKLHGMFFLVFCVIGFITALMGILLYLNVDNIFGHTMSIMELKKAKVLMLILTFNLVITFVFNIYTCILNAYEKFIFQKLISILNTILKPLIMIPLLFFGYKSITMVTVITILNIFVLLSNYIYCKRKLNVSVKYKGFDSKLFKTILGYSIWIFLGIVVDKINWSVDQFVLGAVAGTVAVSIYSVAGQINSLFVSLSGVISGVLLPKISKMVARNATHEEMTNEFIKVARIQLYFVMLTISGIILFGKQFICFWVGNSFIESYYCLLFLSVPLSIPLIQNLGISIRQALNKNAFAAIVNVLVAIINLICSIFLAKAYGPIGSSIGTGVGTLVSIIIINFYYHYSLKLDMKKFWNIIIKLVYKYILLAIGFYVIIMIIPIRGIFMFIVYIMIYTMIYFMITYFLNMNAYEKDSIKKILGKVLVKVGKKHEISDK